MALMTRVDEFLPLRVANLSTSTDPNFYDVRSSAGVFPDQDLTHFTEPLSPTGDAALSTRPSRPAAVVAHTKLTAGHGKTKAPPRTYPTPLSTTMPVSSPMDTSPVEPFAASPSSLDLPVERGSEKGRSKHIFNRELRKSQVEASPIGCVVYGLNIYHPLRHTNVLDDIRKNVIYEKIFYNDQNSNLINEDQPNHVEDEREIEFVDTGAGGRTQIPFNDIGSRSGAGAGNVLLVRGQ